MMTISSTALRESDPLAESDEAEGESYEQEREADVDDIHGIFPEGVGSATRVMRVI